MGFEMESPDRNHHFEAPASAAFQALGHAMMRHCIEEMQCSRLPNPHKGLQKGVIDLVQNHLASSEHAHHLCQVTLFAPASRSILKDSSSPPCMASISAVWPSNAMGFPASFFLALVYCDRRHGSMQRGPRPRPSLSWQSYETDCHAALLHGTLLQVPSLVGAPIQELFHRRRLTLSGREHQSRAALGSEGSASTQNAESTLGMCRCPRQPLLK